MYKEKLLKKFNELKDTVSENDSQLNNIKFLLAKVNGGNNLPSFPIELIKNTGGETFDYYLKLVTKDVESYNKFYQERLAVLPMVAHINSLFVMDEIKITTELPI